MASMLGMVEANVVAYCRAARRLIGLQDDFDDRKPGVIARGVQYLEDKAKIDTVRFRYYICLADDLVRVRNCIVHSEGSLKNRKDADQIKAFVKGIPTISVDDHGRIVLKHGFVENSTHEMQNFLNRLHDGMRKRVDAQL
jgi:hypothetical protein